MSHAPKVYIVLVNWNGWQDTIRCLESIFRSDYTNFTVVVCDNGSTDGSVEHILSWCRGELEASACNPALHALTTPPIAKPVRCTLLDRMPAEQGTGEASPLVLIRTGGNLGFAGGNNVGFRYALARGDTDYVWALNNDTVIDAQALSELVSHMQRDARIGICGSTVRFMDAPEKIQALGGAIFHPWTASIAHIGMGSKFRRIEPDEANAIEGRISYPLGASMMASTEFLCTVGLMREDYFLYFEELDWAERARRQSFRIGYAANSMVYHKAGAAAGSKDETLFSLYMLNRNRLRFISRFNRKYMAINCCALWLEIAKALLKGRSNKAKAIGCAMLGIRLFDLPNVKKDTPCASH